MKLTVEKILSSLNLNDPKQVKEFKLALSNIQDVSPLNRCENLIHLDLSGNRFQVRRQLEGIFGVQSLQSLDLSAAPVCKTPQYRLYVIAHCSRSLHTLDKKPVSAEERTQADQAFPEGLKKHENWKQSQDSQPTNVLFVDDDGDDELFSSRPTPTSSIPLATTRKPVSASVAASASPPPSSFQKGKSISTLFDDDNDDDDDILSPKSLPSTSPSSKTPVSSTISKIASTHVAGSAPSSIGGIKSVKKMWEDNDDFFSSLPTSVPLPTSASASASPTQSSALIPPISNTDQQKSKLASSLFGEEEEEEQQFFHSKEPMTFAFSPSLSPPPPPFDSEKQSTEEEKEEEKEEKEGKEKSIATRSPPPSSLFAIDGLQLSKNDPDNDKHLSESEELKAIQSESVQTPSEASEEIERQIQKTKNATDDEPLETDVAKDQSTSESMEAQKITTTRESKEEQNQLQSLQSLRKAAATAAAAAAIETHKKKQQNRHPHHQSTEVVVGGIVISSSDKKKIKHDLFNDVFDSSSPPSLDPSPLLSLHQQQQQQQQQISTEVTAEEIKEIIERETSVDDLLHRESDEFDELQNEELQISTAFIRHSFLGNQMSGAVVFEVSSFPPPITPLSVKAVDTEQLSRLLIRFSSPSSSSSAKGDGVEEIKWLTKVQTVQQIFPQLQQNAEERGFTVVSLSYSYLIALLQGQLPAAQGLISGKIQVTDIFQFVNFVTAFRFESKAFETFRLEEMQLMKKRKEQQQKRQIRIDAAIQRRKQELTEAFVVYQKNLEENRLRLLEQRRKEEEERLKTEEEVRQQRQVQADLDRKRREESERERREKEEIELRRRKREEFERRKREEQERKRLEEERRLNDPWLLVSPSLRTLLKSLPLTFPKQSLDLTLIKERELELMCYNPSSSSSSSSHQKVVEVQLQITQTILSEVFIIVTMSIDDQRLSFFPLQSKKSEEDHPTLLTVIVSETDFLQIITGSQRLELVGRWSPLSDFDVLKIQLFDSIFRLLSTAEDDISSVVGQSSSSSSSTSTSTSTSLSPNSSFRPSISSASSASTSSALLNLSIHFMLYAWKGSDWSGLVRLEVPDDPIPNIVVSLNPLDVELLPEEQGMKFALEVKAGKKQMINFLTGKSDVESLKSNSDFHCNEIVSDSLLKFSQTFDFLPSYFFNFKRDHGYDLNDDDIDLPPNQKLEEALLYLPLCINSDGAFSGVAQFQLSPPSHVKDENDYHFSVIINRSETPQIKVEMGWERPSEDVLFSAQVSKKKLTKEEKKLPRGMFCSIVSGALSGSTVLLDGKIKTDKVSECAAFWQSLDFPTDKFLAFSSTLRSTNDRVAAFNAARARKPKTNTPLSLFKGFIKT